MLFIRSSRISTPSGTAIRKQPVAELGVDATFQETIVKTAEQASQLRFASSPTVRINGRDIATESRESSCDDCTELCGCGDGTNCRVWAWQGVVHLAAPKALVLDALLKEYVQSRVTVESSSLPFQIPENLQAFFTRSEKRATEEGSCCDQSICCDPADKSACCGNDHRNNRQQLLAKIRIARKKNNHCPGAENEVG